MGKGISNNSDCFLKKISKTGISKSCLELMKSLQTGLNPVCSDSNRMETFMFPTFESGLVSIVETNLT